MTFTLLATDTDHGLLGVATASKSLALGRSVPAIDPTVGAVASQAWGNRKLRHHMLAALRGGASPQQAVEHIPELDEDYAYRQVAVVDRYGGIAAHTGNLTSEWTGHLVGKDHTALGNYLTGGEVLEAMSVLFAAWTPEPGQGLIPVLELAQRLVAALAAGEAAGGDARGKESAALMVAEVSEERLTPPELAVDLRVDHHTDPVRELGMLLDRRIAETLTRSQGR
ncbi:DUF1028 domain-containing protein [Nesterenkonia muleiensis]|uniref:DUF1028 domain-containing protein n=1 Tax=Nesterenkonia muleiensis TaxID=2282648 RepID=UPI000E7261CE|nr:DUF1028 domain-containing protein [Nesterenkonia muleiensis]